MLYMYVFFSRFSCQQIKLTFILDIAEFFCYQYGSSIHWWPRQESVQEIQSQAFFQVCMKRIMNSLKYVTGLKYMSPKGGKNTRTNWTHSCYTELKVILFLCSLQHTCEPHIWVCCNISKTILEVQTENYSNFKTHANYAVNLYKDSYVTI